MGRRDMGIVESGDHDDDDVRDSNLQQQIYNSFAKTGFRIGRRKPANDDDDDDDHLIWPVQLVLQHGRQEVGDDNDGDNIGGDAVRNALEVYKILTTLRKRQPKTLEYD